MTWFRKDLSTIPSKSSEYQSASISRAQAKLNFDLDKRADWEETLHAAGQATEKLLPTTYAMKLYDYVQEVLNGGEYVDEIITRDELSKVILGRQRSPKAQTRADKVASRLIPAIVGVWTTRQYGRQFMVVAYDENNRKVIGLKLASNLQEAEAYRARGQRTADLANGRTLRETEAFNALPANNPAKSLAAAAGNAKP